LRAHDGFGRLSVCLHIDRLAPPAAFVFAALQRSQIPHTLRANGPGMKTVGAGLQ